MNLLMRGDWRRQITRELKHFEAISFYKFIIGANKMIDAQKKNMPGNFKLIRTISASHFRITDIFKFVNNLDWLIANSEI